MNGDDAVVETDDLIGAWLNMIDRAGKDLVRVPNLKVLPDGDRVQHDSKEWCARFFKPAANPHGVAVVPAIEIHRATAATADVIHYGYGWEDMRLSLYETVDFALLRVEETKTELLKLSQDKLPGAITEIAAMLLNTPAAEGLVPVGTPTWPFVLSEPIQEGVRFSTDASQDPHLMKSWTARVDGGIRGGRLYFMCFKKRQSGDGKLILLDSHHWFDGQAWAPYRGGPSR